MDENKIYEGEVIDFIDGLEESKGERFKRKLKSGLKKAKIFVTENKEEIISAGVLASTAYGLYKTFKPTQYEKERKRIDRTYYDPSSGIHWELKRKLTNREREELDNRRRNGDRVADILRDMRVMK